MIERISSAAGELLERYVKERGEKFDEGDIVSCVYNDCILIVSLVDKNLKIDVIAGEMYTDDDYLLS